MNPQTTKYPSLKKVYNNTFSLLKHNKLLFIPFAIFTILELLALIFIYISPRMPFVIVLGPPIKAFFGERFLHYPMNFVLIPKLAGITRTVLSILAGSYLSAVAVQVISNLYEKRAVRMINVFKASFRKYAAFFLVVLIITIIFQGALQLPSVGLRKYFLTGHKTLLFLKPAMWFGPLLSSISFLISVLIQACFAYVIPVLVIEKVNPFKALLKSCGLFFKSFFPTIVLVGIPMLAYVPIIILQYNTLLIINKFYPELVLFIAFLNVLITSLFVDVSITVSTALYYLMKKDSLLQDNKTLGIAEEIQK
ncbi:MAG: hypothetical protein WC695_05360 [Candidatus Omnitrophota bacterium]